MGLLYIRSLFLICWGFSACLGQNIWHLPSQAVGSDLLRLGPLITGGVLDTREELHTHRGGQLLEYSWTEHSSSEKGQPPLQANHLIMHISPIMWPWALPLLFTNTIQPQVLSINTQWNRCCFLDTHLPRGQWGCQKCRYTESLFQGSISDLKSIRLNLCASGLPLWLSW